MMTPYYQDDYTTLYCGDALEILPELSGIGALITDAPYSSGGFTRGDRTARTSEKYQNTGTVKKYIEFFGDNRDARSFAFWCSLWLEMAYSRMVDGAFAAVFSDWRQLPLMSDAIQSGGFVWRGTAVWDKGPSARPQLGRPRLSRLLDDSGRVLREIPCDRQAAGSDVRTLHDEQRRDSGPVRRVRYDFTCRQTTGASRGRNRDVRGLLRDYREAAVTGSFQV